MSHSKLHLTNRITDEQQRRTPGWLPYLDLACAAIAGGMWYAFPQLRAWPLLLAWIPWMVRLGLTGRLTRRTAFDLPLLLFLLTTGVGVWAAYDRSAAWSKFWLIVGGVLIFYALVNAESIGDVRVWLLAFFGAGVALYFLATHDWDTDPAKIEALTRLGRALQAPLPTLPGHRLNPNVAAGMMAMMLPFAGLAAIQARQGTRQAPRSRKPVPLALLAASLGALALTLFGVAMTTSRGAWIALGGALLLAVLWGVSGWLSRGSVQRQSWLFPGLAALIVATALGLGISRPGGLITALEALPGPGAGLDRVELLRNTLTLVRDYPFISAGLGGFMMLFSTYVLLVHVGNIAHSHNLLFDVAIEQGLPGLLLLIWMWLLFALAVWRGLFGSQRRPGSAALGAAALSLGVVLLHGLADDALYSSGGILLLFVPLAFAVPSLQDERRSSRRWLALGLPIAIVLLLAVAMVWRRPLLSRLYSNLGAVHQSQAELGLYTWPEWPVQDAVRRAVDLSRPVAEFEQALALDPGNATANRRLGMIELSLGEYEEALRHLEAAYAAEPTSGTTRQLLGEALIANGRLDEGRAMWAGVRNSEGQLILRISWYDFIGDEQRTEWMKQAAERR